VRHPLDEHRHGGEVVDGSVEEALDLTGVQVDADDALGTRDLEHVGDQLGGDRLASLGLSVLAAVAVEGRDHGDALGRGAPRRVDHDQCSISASLIDISSVEQWPWKMNTSAAADRLAVLAVQLTVRELGESERPELLDPVAPRPPPRARDCSGRPRSSAASW
jgi:hypothetical protein